MAGAPLGNENAKKAKIFTDAVKRALARHGKTVDGGLNKVCDQLINHAIEGERWAIEIIADRLEGKAAQGLLIGEDKENPFTLVARKVVNGSDS